jgi:CRISPR system Cascade subunit CasD
MLCWHLLPNKGGSMDYLLFRLYGPMTAWGDIAVGESRHVQAAPTKAAVMGLVAAALGIDREQEAQHLALNQGYRMASAVLSEGDLLRDYHTVQAPDSVGKARYRTRRDELVTGRDRLGTVLSSRDYRTDAQAVVAIQCLESAPFSLAELQAALLKPKFILYLGRKSCPLAAPLQPEIVSADGFAVAFAQYQPAQSALSDNRVLHSAGYTDYYWEGEVESFADPQQLDARQLMQLTRHDRLLSRHRWQFGRNEIYRYREVNQDVSIQSSHQARN